MKNVPANVAVVPVPSAGRRTTADYISLTKPRLNLLVVASSAAGYYLGASGTPDAGRMALVVIGTALVAAGAAVFNQVLERHADALMRRTRGRALPDGRLTPADASSYGAVLSVGGVALLALNSALAAALAVATLIIYIAVYTPLKRRTPLSTIIGAVPGALPPLIGWTASHGQVSLAGATLFGIVFLWQIPHFMAIAWIYRDDYAKASFPMLPVVDPTGKRAGRQAAAYAAALVVLGTAPTVIGLSGAAYLAVALTLGLMLFALAVRFAARPADDSARQLFLGSIAYLPILWIAMIANRL